MFRDISGNPVGCDAETIVLGMVRGAVKECPDAVARDVEPSARAVARDAELTEGRFRLELFL